MSDLLPMIAGGGGGGCFSRGTQVSLEHGETISIEDIKVGDEVLAFNEEGELYAAKVTHLHVHAPQPLLHVRFWRGEVFITPNHWVQNQYSSFVEIQTLSIEDALVDGMGHLRPIISITPIGADHVYNLTVEKYHTFIADNIRVHNGGHRETYPAVAGAGGGGGGGKGGGGRAAKEDPESLQSKTMVSILDLIGEGQIGGLINGAQSIYFNETPLQNSDGSYNAAGVTWDARYGLPNQSYIPGYADVETPFTLSVQVKVATPITFTVTNPNADRVRAIVSTPSLTSTNLTTGDLHGAELEYNFEMSTNGGAYQAVIADYIPGAAVIGTSGGNVSVTASAPSAKVSCIIKLDATATINYVDATWGATAVLQPQGWNGSSWVNYSAPITVATNPYADNYVQRFAFLYSTQQKQIIKEVYYEFEGYTAGRFVIVSMTAGSTLSLSAPQAYMGSQSIKMKGKTRSRYQRHHLITLPKPGTTWNIRLRRITADSTSGALTNDLYLDSYVEIVDTKLSYVNSAIVGVTLDSALYSKIPNRAYLVNGLYIQIPTNYDPVNRTYSGTWNGTFKVAVSNNPAWVLYDLLTNTRYGLGQYINASAVDKAGLYQVGKYCDVQVPDGFNGYEPRFVINTVIQSLSDAYRLISDISSCFQGMAYWAGGMVGFTQDSPRDPSMAYGRANVVDGMFNYVGTARKDRHSVALVTWNDPLDGFKQKIEYIEDHDLITKIGIRKTEVVAFGCTSRGQANRVGRWILYTEQYESALVTFGVGLDSALVLPGEVVEINDPVRAGKRMAGRIAGITTTSATLDAPIVLASAAEISFQLPDGTFVTRTVLQGAGTYTVLTWTTVLTTLPLLNTMFMVSELTLVPMLARVVGISQDETNKNQFLMSVMEHNPYKYGAIENGWTLTRPITSIVQAKPDVPTNLVLTDILYQSGANYASKLHASWDSDNEGTLKGWSVRLLGPSLMWVDYGIVKDAMLEVPNVIDGQDYRIEVRAVNIIGIQSDAVTATRTIQGKDGPPSNVTGIVVTDSELGVHIAWATITDIDLAYYEVRVGADWATGTMIGRVNNNFIDLDPQTIGVHTWIIRARDTTDHYSTLDGVATFNVGLPGTPTVVAAFVGSTVEIGWTTVAGADSYYVEILNGLVVVRTFETVTNHFSYTIENSRLDGGPFRSITVKVKARKDLTLGAAGSVTSDVNAAPVAPSLILVPGIGAISITVSPCTELDYVGTMIHASQTLGFTPNSGNLIYEGSTFFLQGEITGTWYYKAAHYDDFGKTGLSYSTEMSEIALSGVAGITSVAVLPANPAAVDGQLAIFLDVVDAALRGIYGWDGLGWARVGDLAAGSITYDMFDPSIAFGVEIEAGEIISEHLADGAVKYEKMDPNLAFQVEVEAGEITSTHIADNSISTPKLMAGAVIANKIAADQITANHLQADSVTTLKIAAGAVVSDKILANQILAGHIGANVIQGTHILAGAVTANKITATSLSAITANMGALTAGSLTMDISGYVKGGQTSYNTGTGFWLGYNAPNYKFSVGNSGGNRLTWDGFNLAVFGNLTLGANNFVAAGQTGYNTGTGFWLGYSSGVYKMSIGDPAGKAIFWDGATLTIQGDVIATGNINANAVSRTYQSYTDAWMQIPFGDGHNGTASGSFTQVQYLNVLKEAGLSQLVVNFSFRISNTGQLQGRVPIQLRRNGTPFYASYGVVGDNVNYTYIETGPQGTYTYEIYAASTSGTSYTGSYLYLYARSIYTMELKR